MTDAERTDDIPDPLTERRVRHLLYCLQLYATPMSLPDIADQLTVWEQGGRGEEFLQQRLRTYDSLHHDHLPRLCHADVVTYEPSTELVGLGPAAEGYTAVVEAEFESEIARLLEAEQTTFRPDGTH